MYICNLKDEVLKHSSSVFFLNSPMSETPSRNWTSNKLKNMITK